ncbi:MAG: acyltransferase family protein [Lachnospiraceae bacterium]|nr:acyltransferase family protein [Lachnospiraceae bacterium]
METDSGYKRLGMIYIIKAAACIMIFLYHCNTILPGEWKFLTLFGQDLGNNLFFMVSGFALYPSIVRTGKNRFFPWYFKRLIRILPMTVIAYILTYLMGYYSFSDKNQLFVVFIYPTLYWFITAILIFYILVFFIGKYCKIRTGCIMCAILAVMYLLLTGRQERLYVIGLLSMLSGFYLRSLLEEKKNSTDINKPDKTYLYKLVLSMVLSGFIFIAGELMTQGYLQALFIICGALCFGISSLMAGFYADAAINKYLNEGTVLFNIVRYIGNMALPLYLVQCFCSGYIGFTIGLMVNFPMSFAVNFIVVWLLGSVLYLADFLISRMISRLSKV